MGLDFFMASNPSGLPVDFLHAISFSKTWNMATTLRIQLVGQQNVSMRRKMGKFAHALYIVSPLQGHVSICSRNHENLELRRIGTQGKKHSQDIVDTWRALTWLHAVLGYQGVVPGSVSMMILFGAMVQWLYSAGG